LRWDHAAFALPGECAGWLAPHCDPFARQPHFIISFARACGHTHAGLMTPSSFLSSKHRHHTRCGHTLLFGHTHLLPAGACGDTQLIGFAHPPSACGRTHHDVRVTGRVSSVLLCLAACLAVKQLLCFDEVSAPLAEDMLCVRALSSLPHDPFFAHQHTQPSASRSTMEHTSESLVLSPSGRPQRRLQEGTRARLGCVAVAAVV
jgi:hypothetical protein